MKRDDGTVLRLKGLDFLEPPEAQRKGRSTPLPWAKMRSPADSSPEGERHALRIEGLKARRNGWLALAIYHEIVRVLTARSAALRWYLIGSDFRPATAAEVAQWIAQPDRRAVGAALRALEAVGLLERVRAPDFAAAHREDRKPIVPDGPVAPSDAETGEDRPSSPDERTVSGAAPETCAENGASEAEKRAAFRRGAGQRGGDYSQETRDGRGAGAGGPTPRAARKQRRVEA